MIDSPSLYIGTFAKYSSGSIAGAWLNLEDYSDKDDFLAACVELHRDEPDPEFMVQDYSNLPRRFYSESYIDPAIWDWLELNDDDKELLEVYLGHVDQGGTIEEARDAFSGKFDSEEDWAADFWESCGMLEGIPEHAQNYIDYAAYAHDCRCGGDMTFVPHGGEVWCFSNNC